jgi:hypothetical protein
MAVVMSNARDGGSQNFDRANRQVEPDAPRRGYRRRRRFRVRRRISDSDLRRPIRSPTSDVRRLTRRSEVRRPIRRSDVRRLIRRSDVRRLIRSSDLRLRVGVTPPRRMSGAIAAVERLRSAVARSR